MRPTILFNIVRPMYIPKRNNNNYNIIIIIIIIFLHTKTMGWCHLGLSSWLLVTTFLTALIVIRSKIKEFVSTISTLSFWISWHMLLHFLWFLWRGRRIAVWILYYTERLTSSWHACRSERLPSSWHACRSERGFSQMRGKML